jgi:TRAP-type C4-dicarboxylate transport system permease small subunit
LSGRAALAGAGTPALVRLRGSILLLPKIAVGGLVLFAIGVMLAGVFLRYVMIQVTDWLDVDPVGFFWVEELGELALAWLTLLGAALGVMERSHFALAIVAHRLPPRLRRAVHVLNHVLIALFGALVAWQGWKLVLLNLSLASPALEFSLGWLYGAAVVGGVLMALYALAAAAGPVHEHGIDDVRE